MDNIDGFITKDDVYRLLSDFRIYIPADIRHQMTEKVKALLSIDVGSGDWISVEDKLPEEDVRVIVCSSIKTIGTAYQINNLWFTRDLLVSGLSTKITHWMPLPEPPKEV